MEIHGRSWNLLEHSMIFSSQIVYNKLTPISKEERPPLPWDSPHRALPPHSLPLSYPYLYHLSLLLLLPLELCGWVIVKYHNRSSVYIIFCVNVWVEVSTYPVHLSALCCRQHPDLCIAIALVFSFFKQFLLCFVCIQLIHFHFHTLRMRIVVSLTTSSDTITKFQNSSRPPLPTGQSL